MYESFYGLKVKPFSLLPDPAFLYLSKQHEMAITLLEYSLENQAGFCVITGKAGTGKTTLLRRLLNQIGDDVSIGLITNTHHSFGELLRWILHAFDLEENGDNRAGQHQIFIDYLIGQYAKNRRTMLIIDEAQNMSAEALEELRMLSNINSEKDLLLQVILVGQPPLRDILQRPELEQFAQRVAVDFHLDSLNVNETRGYIRHRLLIAGGEHELFTDDACKAVFIHSSGIPRLINLLCDLSLVYAYAGQAAVVTEELVEQVVNERQKHGALPIFSDTSESRAMPRVAMKNAQASTAATMPDTVTTRIIHPASDAKRVTKAAVSAVKPGVSGKGHVHAVKNANADETRKPQVAPRTSTLTDGVNAVSASNAPSDAGAIQTATGMPTPFSQADSSIVSVDPVMAAEVKKNNAVSKVSPTAGMPSIAESFPPASSGVKMHDLKLAAAHLTPQGGKLGWMASRRAAKELAGIRRHAPMLAIILLTSVAAPAWFYFDRPNLTRAFLDKPSPTRATAVIQAKDQKPAGIVPVTGQASVVQPLSGSSSMKQEIVKSIEPQTVPDEAAKVRQIERERDAVLAVTEAAAREREAMRKAAQARESALAAEHEAALIRERERANQMARDAEKAARQARAAALAAAAKAGESELFPSPATKVEETRKTRQVDRSSMPRNVESETTEVAGASEAAPFTANPCKGPSARFLSTCE